MLKLYIGGELAQVGKSIYDLTLITNEELIDMSCYHSWVIQGVNNWNLKLNISCITKCKDQKFIYDYYDGYRNNQICIVNGLAMIKYPVDSYQELEELAELGLSTWNETFTKINEELKKRIRFYSNDDVSNSEINSEVSKYLINNYSCYVVFNIIKFCTDNDFLNTFILDLEQSSKYEISNKVIDNSQLSQITLRPTEKLYVLGHVNEYDFKTIKRI